MNAFGSLGANFGQKTGKASKGRDVGRVGGEAKLSGKVLDVGLLEKAHAAGDLVVDVQAA